MILIDVFVHDGKIVLWLKDNHVKDHYQTFDYSPKIYFNTFNENFARKVLHKQNICKVKKLHLVKGLIEVLEIQFHDIISFKFNFWKLESRLRNVGNFYNVDIPIEEMYMFEHDLFPLKDMDGDDINTYEYKLPDFRVAKIKISDDGVEFNENLISVNEFIEVFNKYDPDIIFVSGQQRELIELSKKGIQLNRYCKDSDMKVKGNSFFSYGQAYYRESSIYLKGRLLLNSSSFMIDDFNLYSVMEGARICRNTIQRCASHSVGAAITNLLIYHAYKLNYLIPYRVGVYEKIKPFRELVRCDRGAYTLEPKVGVHKDVAELDFVSMFPSIISRYNLSPEKLNCSCCKEKIVGTDYNFCQKEKGIVPIVCDYLIDRRMYFKTKKDHISQSKVGYLKWLLVVIFGFQSFRNKKIGSIEVHESINAIARYSLHRAIRIAEHRGYEVVHGIVDSLYVRKKDLSDISNLVDEISKKTRLPIEFKKVYKFMTFLSSVNNDYMPVPSAYYGVTYDKQVKVRGIELRQRSSPRIVKNMQYEIIEKMSEVDDIKKIFSYSIKILKNYIKSLDDATVDDLSIKVRIGKETYKANCPQKIIVEQMKKKGIIFSAGQSIKYIIKNFHHKEYVEISEYKGVFDRLKYIELLKKALCHLFLSADIENIKLDGTIQKKISDYLTPLLLKKSLYFLSIPLIWLISQSLRKSISSLPISSFPALIFC